MRALHEQTALPRRVRTSSSTASDSRLRVRLRERGRALFAHAEDPRCVSPVQAAEYLLSEAALPLDHPLRHELETFFQDLVDAAS